MNGSSEMEPLLRTAYEDLEEKIFPTPSGSTYKKVVETRLHLEPIANGVSPLRERFSRGLAVLMAGVGLLLIMTCANVAGLLLGRSAVRAHELSIRLALGARPGRVARQLLTESLTLALLGGAAGTLLTYAFLPVLIRALPPIRDRAAVVQPLALHIDIDLRVPGFALAITLLTALLFGLSPALRSARFDLSSTLRAGRTATRRGFARNLVVVAQVALCTLILTGAALLVETLQRMRSMNAGFDRERIVTFTIDPAIKGYKSEQARALSRKLLAQARALPSVATAANAAKGLMRGTGMKTTYQAAGAHIARSDFLNTSTNSITPGYFEAMGMHLVAGRDFTWLEQEREKPPYKVIVNQAFARRFFPGKDAISQWFGRNGGSGVATADNEIIGVVSDAKYRSLREQIPPTVYTAVVGGFDSQFILHVRTRRLPEAIVGPIRDALRSLDPASTRSSGTPGRTRPKICVRSVRTPALASPSSVTTRRSTEAGTRISGLVSAERPLNSRGRTPITVKGWPWSVIFRPRIAGSRRYRRCQKS
jgi:predicted permease